MIITKDRDFRISFDTVTGDVWIETIGDDTYIIEFKAKKIDKIDKEDGEKVKVYDEKDK